MSLERRQSPCYAQGVCPLVVSPRDRCGPSARGYRQRQPPVSGGGLAMAGKTWELLHAIDLCDTSRAHIADSREEYPSNSSILLTALSSAKPSRMTQYRKLGEGDAVVDRVRDREVIKRQIVRRIILAITKGGVSCLRRKRHQRTVRLRLSL